MGKLEEYFHVQDTTSTSFSELRYETAIGEPRLYAALHTAGVGRRRQMLELLYADPRVTIPAEGTRAILEGLCQSMQVGFFSTLQSKSDV